MYGDQDQGTGAETTEKMLPQKTDFLERPNRWFADVVFISPGVPCICSSSSGKPEKVSAREITRHCPWSFKHWIPAGRNG